MRKYINIIILLLICLNSNAQIPGYLGKRDIIGVGAQWFPSYKNYGYTTSSYDPKWNSSFSLKNYRYKSAFNIFYERVIDRYISMNFNYNYQRGGYRSEEESIDSFDINGNPYSHYSYQDYNVVSHRYEVLFKFLFRNSGGLAPLGPYIGVGLNYNRINGWAVGKEQSMMKKSLLAMSVSWGKTRVLGDNIMIDYGIRCTPFYFNGEVNILNQPVKELKPASYMFARNLLFGYFNIGILL